MRQPERFWPVSYTHLAILDDQNTIENNQEKLFVALGWKHDDRPEIGTLPEPDPDRIAAMNPAADKAQAVENSYTMKINKRKLENAKSDDTKETLEKTIREDTQTIGASVTGSYQNVLAAKASMDLKGAQAQLQEKTMQTTERQYQLGMIGKLDYLNRKYAYDSAVIQAQIAKYNLLQACLLYTSGLYPYDDCRCCDWYCIWFYPGTVRVHGSSADAAAYLQYDTIYGT